VAFYSDKHGVFRVNHEGALRGDGMTQFGRALDALNIDIICVNSSQAKGRVERAHKTLQDRLVKELRLAGARTLAEGNALLPAFMTDYNTRFAKPAADAKNLHRPSPAGDVLADAFAWKEERTLSRALTLQYDKVIFILEPSDQAKAAIGKRVMVVDHPMAGCRSATRVSSCPTARSTRCARSRRPRSSRTSGSALLSPLSASNRSNAQKRAADQHRADAINAMRDCSRSAETLCEPSERCSLGKTRAPFREPAAGVDRALRCARAPRPPAARTR
jgi:hypothetical protein